MGSPSREEFLHITDTLINWDIEEHNGHSKKLLTRQDFWKQLYLPRRNEIAVFERFLESPRSLMVINGNVGVGKSTYVRHKFEYQRLCRGVIANMIGRLHDLCSTESLSEDLRRVVGEEYRKALTDNIKASILYSTSYQDISHVPDAHQRQHKHWNHALTESRSRNRLALNALIYLQRDPVLSDYVSRTFGPIEAEDPDEYNEILRERYMQQGDHYTNEVLPKLRWKHYVTLFHEMEGDNAKPHVMVFDNLDWLSMTVIQHEFINIALDILTELKREGVAIKAVICVRDENVAYFHHNAGASFNIFQVLFSKDDYAIQGVSDIHYLQTDEDDFSHKVLERRIALTQQMLSAEFPEEYALFEGILQNFWMKNGTIRNDLGHFRFGDLCNGSLRIMLGLVHDCTLDLVKRLKEKQLAYLPGSGNNEPYHTVRGSLICQLAHNRRTREIMKEFYQSILQEQGEAYCCVYRMVLVLLDNHRTRNNRTYTFDNLQADLRFLFPNLSESDTRRYLKDLYFCGEHHGELIVIYQQRLIRQPGDIQPDALLQITGRGQVFLRTILIHYDFFKGVLAYKDNKRKPRHILFDMNPDEALERSLQVKKFVDRLADRHVKVLQEVVYPNLLGDRKLRKTPYDAFTGRMLTVGGTFYLERVCDNHKGLLKAYIAECLRGAEACTLLLDPQEKAALNEYVQYDWVKAHCIKDTKGATYADKDIEEQVARLPEDHALRRLWEECCGKYDAIKVKLDKMRHLRWEEVKAAK